MNELPDATSAAIFDDYAARYEAVLNQALRSSGESHEYFARGRIEWLKHALADRGVRSKRVLDFGCGIGTATPLLRDHLHAEQVVGVEVSRKSLDLARARYGSEQIQFALPTDFDQTSFFDIAYCNGVVHHIPVKHRGETIAAIHRSLQPDGLFAVFENNPWNPGARYCMAVNPWDRDAVPITAPVLRRLLKTAGFEILTTNYLFIFPRWLSILRCLEAPLRRVPLGAQYVVLVRK